MPSTRAASFPVERNVLTTSAGDGLDEPVLGPTDGTLCAFSSPRRRLLGTGVATVIDVPAPWRENLSLVTETLADIAAGDPPDDLRGNPPRPVAFGALPYDGSAAARFIVPATLWTHTSDGDRSRLDVHEATDRGPALQNPPTQPGPHTSGAVDASEAVHPSEALSEPTEVAARSVVEPRLWCDAVAEARDRIRAGELTKVVLAREIEVRSDVALNAATLWNRLCVAHPGAFCFSIDGFVGASPELLVSRSGSTVRARPMAGTTPRSGTSEVDQQAAAELLASEKNRWEHQITIEAVHDALLGWCSFLDAEPSPSVVAAGPVQHLATMVEGRLSRPEPSVLELVAALHPTPAVGGHPTDEAIALQSELEPADRGRYAGPVGWVDSEGNGTFAVGIRSIEIAGRTGRLFAGVGVVEDSDPLEELAESRAKAQALLSALVRI